MKPIVAVIMAIAMVFCCVPVIAAAPTISDAMTLDEALNIIGGNLTFTSEGTYPWTVEGGYAKSSNQRVGNSSSSISTTVTADSDDFVIFDYKVSCEEIYDFLQFSIDGTPVTNATWYGNIDWTTASFPITEGEHTLTWTYSKDGLFSRFEDTAWLDNICVGDISPVTGVQLQETLEISVGRYTQLEWVVLPGNTLNKSVTFSSSDPNVASVDNTGLVTGVAEGEAIITITTRDGGFTDTCLVTVTEALPSVTFYGYAAVDWVSDIHANWITFEDHSPQHTETLGLAMPDDTFAAAFVDGNIYGYIRGTDSMGFVTDCRYYIIDFDTWTISYPGSEMPGVTLCGMAYDHSRGQMYALGSNSSNSRSVYSININTGFLTEEFVVPTTPNGNLMTFAISTDGVAYATTYGNDSHLYSIDLEAGTVRDIGSTGLQLQYYQAMTYDHNTGRLFWAQYYDDDTGGLYEVNTETAECTPLGNIMGNAEVTAMFVANDLPLGIYEPDEYGVGDVNMDGEISVPDAILEARYVLELTTLSDEALLLADMNGSGSINMDDVLLILRAAVS